MESEKTSSIFYTNQQRTDCNFFIIMKSYVGDSQQQHLKSQQQCTEYQHAAQRRAQHRAFSTSVHGAETVVLNL